MFRGQSGGLAGVPVSERGHELPVVAGGEAGPVRKHRVEARRNLLDRDLKEGEDLRAVGGIVDDAVELPVEAFDDIRRVRLGCLSQFLRVFLEPPGARRRTASRRPWP